MTAKTTPQSTDNGSIQHTDTETCPLCHGRGDLFYRDCFFCCRDCLGIFKPTRFLPSPAAEKARYEQHNNDVNNLSYQRFVSPIVNAVKQDFCTDSIGLDFGAGTGPVISKLLTDAGYTLQQFDPFFCNQPEVLNAKYDYIVCCEVIEHFHNPHKEFTLLKQRLKPNGRLYCMTHLYTDEIDFANWYYKNDETHVFIYQRDTLMKIKGNYQFSELTITNRLSVFTN